MDDANRKIAELNLWERVTGVAIPLLIVIVNSIEIHVLRKSSNKPFYEKILLSLTICDLIGGVLSCFGVPIEIIVKVEFYNLLYWNLWGFWICYWTLTAVLHLIVIGLDRVWALAKPFHHRRYHTKLKLVVVVALSWCLPLIFVIFHIVLVVSKEMNIKEAYFHHMIAMRIDVAKIIVIADIILIASYCSIICTAYRKTKDVRTNMHSAQRHSTRTLMLCIGIVSVFIVCTTPLVVVHVTTWNSPYWLKMLSSSLAPMNQICNSVLYLTQKYRSRRSSLNRRNISVALEESRL